METPEQVLRNRPHKGKLAQQIVPELITLDLTKPESSKMAKLRSDSAKLKLNLKGKKGKIHYRRANDRNMAATRRKHHTRVKKQLREQKLLEQEELLSQLIIRLKAGDPNHPDYEHRLRCAKHTTKKFVPLPVAARRKWSSSKFREDLMARGFTYNLAEYKGWLPYEDAKAMQKKLVGARSRGEYEVLLKVFGFVFLPNRPDRVYLSEWKGWSEFLDIPNVFGFGALQMTKLLDKSQYLPFHEALTIARSFKCKSIQQWRKVCKEGKVPMNVPISPHAVYDEYVSINHWLGIDSAMDLVTGKVTVKEMWVLYADGRGDVVWFVKVKEDGLAKLKATPNVTVHRVYLFENGMSDVVKEILDTHTEQYDMIVKERYVPSRQALLALVSDLDSKLLWMDV